MNRHADTVVIQPARGWLDLGLSDLWSHRDLLYYLVWRDIKVRYKQTVIGIVWAVLQPLGVMAVFSLVFGLLLDVSTGRPGVSYPVFAFSALVPWHYFTHAVSGATTSLVEQKEVITRVYFPRLMLPLAAVMGQLVDLAMSMLVLAGLMAFSGIAPTTATVTLPLFVLLAVAGALGLGLWLSALNAIYRDFRYLVPFGLTVLLYISPVIYPSSRVPPQYLGVYGLNPMAGVIEGFRWALLGGAPPAAQMLWVSTGTAVILLLGGLIFFRRAEGTVSDVV